MEYQVVIPAAGRGKRMKADRNKLLLPLCSRPVIAHTLEVFQKDPNCQGIILVVQPEEEAIFSALLHEYQLTKVTGFALGGEERQYSVYNGVKKLRQADIVLVHDGARPFITDSIIHQLADTANETGAAIAAVRVKDTIKRDVDGLVAETVERSSLWSVQTPQAFRVSVLLEAFQKAEADGFLGTDESSLVERINWPIQIVEGSYDNIKLTTPEDLYFAEAIINKRKD